MQFCNCIRLLYRLLSVVASRQELNLKKSVADQMERALKEQKQEIETRDTQSAQHGQKLEKLEEQADKATQQVRKMEVSLAECHKEIEMYIGQLKEARDAHEQELEERRLEVRCIITKFERQPKERGFISIALSRLNVLFTLEHNRACTVCEATSANFAVSARNITPHSRWITL